MIDTRISAVRGRQIFDSRGNPTVAADVLLCCGARGTAAVPSGASTGIFEAHELRDGGSEYNGKGVTRAVRNINENIAEAMHLMDSARQREIDGRLIKLDGSGDKSKLGANAVLAVSLACARAAAAAYSLPLYRWLGGINAHALPRPMMNILNGGAHAANNIDIQEFMIMPAIDCSFAKTMRMCTEVYASLGKLLRERGLSTTVGDEGGFAPDLPDDEKALGLICDAIEAAGYKPGDEIGIALDAAASEWTDGDGYRLPKRGDSMTRSQMIEYFKRLTESYPIVSIEDPLGQEDYDGFTQITKELRSVQIVGDDLFVTNNARLREGIARKSASAILIKPNQIGTLTETLEAIETAKRNGYGVIISHRSGETEDTTIADLAVGVNSGQIKTGAPARSDRVAKYNRLLEIEAEIRQ